VKKKNILLAFVAFFSVFLSNAAIKDTTFLTGISEEVRKSTSLHIQFVLDGLRNFQAKKFPPFNAQIVKSNNVEYLHCSLLVSKDFDEDELINIGVKIGSRAGNILTVLIPADKIKNVASLTTVFYLDIGITGNLLMDNVRQSVQIDDVHQAINLPSSYYGEDVIIGVIDVGFDYTHPNLYAGMENCRIKRVWEQCAANGTPPSDFIYGRELKTQAEISGAGTDDSNNTHGTHVTGIATGSGISPLLPYMGVAPLSDIVLVSTDMSAEKIQDGIKYICDYATFANKPCVINISIGTNIGAHDGTSMFNQYCDNLMNDSRNNKGKIIVMAGGNDGMSRNHISRTFTPANDLMDLR
jgi:hypothetical protein